MFIYRSILQCYFMDINYEWPIVILLMLQLYWMIYFKDVHVFLHTLKVPKCTNYRLNVHWIISIHWSSMYFYLVLNLFSTFRTFTNIKSINMHTCRQLTWSYHEPWILDCKYGDMSCITLATSWRVDFPVYSALFTALLYK